MAPPDLGGNFCRACLLSTLDVTGQLFALNDEWMCIYTFCTSVDLSKHESLPKTLCESCYESLEKFYAFKNQCVDSNVALLRTLLNKGGIKQEAVDPLPLPPVKLESDAEDEAPFDHFGDGFDADDRSSAGDDIGVRVKAEFDETCINEKRTRRKTYVILPTYEAPKIEKPRVKRAKREKPLTTRIRKKTAEPKTFFCSFKKCKSEGYSHRDALEAHHLIKHKNKQIQIECHLCDIGQFKSFKSLRFHVTNTHYRTPHPCPECGKVKKSRRALQKHLANHRESKKEFICHYCGVTRKSMQTFRTHVAAHLKQETSPARARERRTFQCAQCSKLLWSPQQLKLHEEIVHLGIRYPCAACKMVCTSRNGLRKHMLVHEEPRFECDVCKKRFRRKPYFKAHLRMHRGDKPYACAFCPMRFVDSSRRNEHVRVHTGAKPYACGVCGRAFSQHGTYKRHLKDVHKMTFGRPAVP